MIKDIDPAEEGHTREWADRARVEMNPEEDVRKMASPNQSPVEEKNKNNPSCPPKKPDDEPVY